jgi:hypothetical protein
MIKGKFFPYQELPFCFLNINVYPHIFIVNLEASTKYIKQIILVEIIIIQFNCSFIYL